MSTPGEGPLKSIEEESASKTDVLEQEDLVVEIVEDEAVDPGSPTKLKSNFEWDPEDLNC